LIFQAGPAGKEVRGRKWKKVEESGRKWKKEGGKKKKKN
jgi:hypothetical protein